MEVPEAGGLSVPKAKVKIQLLRPNYNIFNLVWI